MKSTSTFALAASVALTLLAGCTAPLPVRPATTAPSARPVPAASAAPRGGAPAPVPQARRTAPTVTLKPEQRAAARSTTAPSKLSGNDKSYDAAARQGVGTLRSMLSSLRGLQNKGNASASRRKAFHLFATAAGADAAATNAATASTAPTKDAAATGPAVVAGPSNAPATVASEAPQPQASAPQDVPQYLYEQIIWSDSGAETEPIVTETGTEVIYTSTGTVEGKVGDANGNLVTVERYTYTNAYRYPKNGDETAPVPFHRTETVQLSANRDLGTYDTVGTTTTIDGHETVNSTLVITLADGNKYTTQLETHNEGNHWSSHVTGETFNGGTIDIVNDGTNDFPAPTESEPFPTSGSTTSNQHGTIKSADGHVFELTTSSTTKFGSLNGQAFAATKGTLELTIDHTVRMSFNMEDDETGRGTTKMSGELFALPANGDPFKLGDIAVDPDTYDGTLTFPDGENDTFDLGAVFEVQAISWKV